MFLAVEAVILVLISVIKEGKSLLPAAFPFWRRIFLCFQQEEQ